MRVYMLPITVTATLMSAHLALAARVQQVSSGSVAPAQADLNPNGEEQRTSHR